jgi:hypothetical protein
MRYGDTVGVAKAGHWMTPPRGSHSTQRCVAATWVLSLGAALAMSGPPALAAAPDDCKTEHLIFWDAWNSGSSQWRTAPHGTENHIVLKQRTLDQACADHGVAYSTAHMMLGGNQANTAEVGYSQHLNASGGEFLVYFTEVDIQVIQATRAIPRVGLALADGLTGIRVWVGAWSTYRARATRGRCI